MLYLFWLSWFIFSKLSSSFQYNAFAEIRAGEHCGRLGQPGLCQGSRGGKAGKSSQARFNFFCKWEICSSGQPSVGQPTRSRTVDLSKSSSPIKMLKFFSNFILAPPGLLIFCRAIGPTGCTSLNRAPWLFSRKWVEMLGTKRLSTRFFLEILF